MDSSARATIVTDRDVVVVGAGPVGLTVALGLARRGISVEILERKAAPAFLPKMERCNARSMEIFRRLGAAEAIRAASGFNDVPMDVFVVTDLSEPPLVHLEYPSVNRSVALTRECRDGSMPLEPYQLISQYTLEPLLVSIVEKLPNVRIRFDCELASFEQDEAGVRATLRSEKGELERVSCHFLVGCDGGSSTVRKGLGIELKGRGRISQVNQVFFRSETLFEKIRTGRGRHYYSNTGAIVVQDDLRHFMLNVHQAVESDEAARDQLLSFLGLDVDVEILHRSAWWQHLLVAERYSEGRVFLAGDAEHLYIPTGGLGMNTGVGDADNLTWKMAAVLEGWGGPSLLSSYDAERRPVGLRNCSAAGAAAVALRTWRSATTDNFRADTPEGAAERARIAVLAAAHQPMLHEMIGTELGYCYSDSEVVCNEVEAVVDPGPTEYLPTTVPGVRLPHVWLADGTSVHDHLGDGFTLLRLDGTAEDTVRLESAMRALGAPLNVLDISDPVVRKVYERDLILVRPDLHVVWRGDSAPSDPDLVARTVTGHQPPKVAA